MSNNAELLYEIAKNTRKTYEGMCCILGSYNKTTTQSITAGNSVTLPLNSFHSVSWDLASGAGITINNGVSTPTTYYSNGSIEFSTTNSQAYTISAVTGTVRLITLY